MSYPANRTRTAILTIKSPFIVEGGTDVRMLGMIRALSKFSDVYVIPLYGESQEGEIEPNIHQLASSGIQSPANHDLLRAIKQRPEDPYAIFSDDLTRSFVSQHLGAISAHHVIANRLMMWRILADLKLAPDIRRILDLDESAHRLFDSFTTNSSTSLPWRLHADFQAKVALYESSVLATDITLLVSSQLEADIVESISDATSKVYQIQHVVVDDRITKATIPTRETGQMKRILFPANFAYPPNRAALEEIVEQIAPALPEFEFRIAGFSLNLKAEWNRANISAVSPVPDMAVEFKKSDLLIVPLRWGAGTRVKVLEAMKHGVPVIATEFAVEGLGLTAGVHYLSADSTEEFIDLIKKISQDLSLTDRLRVNAFEFVGEHFAVSSISAKLQEILAR